jgi:hypothetical protein
MIAVVFLAIVALVLLGLLWWRVRRRGWQPGSEEAEPGWYFTLEDEHLAVREVCALLGGEGTWLMIEGDLRPVEVTDLGATAEVPEGLRRHTTWSFPKEQVAVLPLPEGRIDQLDVHLAPLLYRVNHLQIARNGRLDFGAYDWFEFAWASDRVPEAALRQLEARGILSSLKRTPDEW